MRNTSLNDYELLYYCRQMDEKALKYLIDKYQPFVLKITSDAISKNPYCEIYRDEFIAEAIEVIYRSIWNYRDNRECSFGTYFYTCASRRVKTLMRHYLREANMGNLYALSLDAMVRDDSDSTYLEHFGTENDQGNPVYSLSYKEAIMRVNETLSSLNELDQKVLACYLDEMSYCEAAKRLNFSKKKYDNLVQKVKRNIKGKIYD